MNAVPCPASRTASSPPTPLARTLSFQSILFAVGEGVFLTGSAFLAIEWGTPGWLLIGAVVVVAAVGIHPAARAAERHLQRHAAPQPA